MNANNNNTTNQPTPVVTAPAATAPTPLATIPEVEAVKDAIKKVSDTIDIAFSAATKFIRDRDIRTENLSEGTILLQRIYDLLKNEKLFENATMDFKTALDKISSLPQTSNNVRQKELQATFGDISQKPEEKKGLFKRIFPEI